MRRACRLGAYLVCGAQHCVVRPHQQQIRVASHALVDQLHAGGLPGALRKGQLEHPLKGRGHVDLCEHQTPQRRLQLRPKAKQLCCGAAGWRLPQAHMCVAGVVAQVQPACRRAKGWVGVAGLRTVGPG